MNREIKFRGKRLDTNEWVYGSFIYRAFRCWIEVTCEVLPTPDQYGLSTGFTLEVIPETVSQYTGLQDATKWDELTIDEKRAWKNTTYTDKDGDEQANDSTTWNGKDIYEGDVIKDEGGEKGVVRFGEYEHLYHDGMYGYYLDCGEVIYDLSATGCGKIIGSIHDNPELK